MEQQAAVRRPTRAQPVPDANPVAAAGAAAPAPPGTSLVGWVTGPESPNDTINRFAITGTDLGIMWDNGSGEVLMAFGDTYGYCGVRGQQWRYNALFRSRDGALAKTTCPTGRQYSGSPLWSQGLSKQIINSIKFSPTEKGIIPTAGIAVGGTQYVNFMSIKSWDSDGRWTTNFSGDRGVARQRRALGCLSGLHPPVRAEQRRPGPLRRGQRELPAGGVPQAGTRRSLHLFVRHPVGARRCRHTYRAFCPQACRTYAGTSTGVRIRTPGCLAIQRPRRPVIPGPVSEMSAQYNTYLNQYLVLYGNGANDMVMRTAPAPQGPWSPERLIVPSMQFPGGIYAPFLHPWSTGKELYYNVSLWSAYNVMLMRTVLP